MAMLEERALMAAADAAESPGIPDGITDDKDDNWAVGVVRDGVEESLKPVK